ncbi:MAG: phosphoribosylformylglycinamidine synthase I [Fimbriimonadaceae bacterium]|nr:phosphoribosylformylglycinamidine synthase I [Fimbriimonadaceae bacterium]
MAAVPRVAVVQFPGMNCEAETKLALEAVGLEAEIYRWNRDPAGLDGFDAMVVGGGFSYQDRVRSGVIAAREPICERLLTLAGQGRPILGICNGAQVLVETGLVPGLQPGRIEVALAPNRMTQGGRVVRRDYFCTWTHLRLVTPPQRCVWTAALQPAAVLAIPMAHGEGRFTSATAGLFEQLAADGQLVWQYCDPAGVVSEDFPICPNGSTRATAAVCNPAGNVLAIMPHPERASWLRQVPQDLPGPWGAARRAAYGQAAALAAAGPGRGIFASLAQSLAVAL